MEGQELTSHAMNIGKSMQINRGGALTTLKQSHFAIAHFHQT
jgi:hypothetical protein